MVDPLPFTCDEMIRLARNAVTKIDTYGPRGTTLCNMQEIEAMAAMLVLLGVLMPAPARDPAMTHAEQFGSLAQAIQPVARGEG